MELEADNAGITELLEKSKSPVLLILYPPLSIAFLFIIVTGYADL